MSLVASLFCLSNVTLMMTHSMGARISIVEHIKTRKRKKERKNPPTILLIMDNPIIEQQLV